MEQRIKIIFLKYGVILGVIYLALTILSFYFITSVTQSPILFIAGPIFFRLVIPVIITIIFCLKGRSKIGGLWTFKQATTGIFVMFFVAFLILFISYDFIFDRYVEPDGIQKTQIAAIKAKTLNLKQRGYNQKAIDKNIVEMKKDIAQQTNTITPGGVMQQVIFSIIFIFLFALIFGSFFKNAEYVSGTQTKQ